MSESADISYIEIQGAIEDPKTLQLVVATATNSPEGRNLLEEYQKVLKAEHDFFNNCTKKYPNLANYTIGLLKNQRNDKDIENEKIAERSKDLAEYLYKLSSEGKLTDQAQGILITLGNWVNHGEERFNPNKREGTL